MKRRRDHRWMPRVLGTGSAVYVIPSCSCGWSAPDNGRTAAREEWQRHVADVVARELEEAGA